MIRLLRVPTRHRTRRKAWCLYGIFSPTSEFPIYHSRIGCRVRLSEAREHPAYPQSISPPQLRGFANTRQAALLRQDSSLHPQRPAPLQAQVRIQDCGHTTTTGLFVGLRVGFFVGETEGALVGREVGFFVGYRVGNTVGFTASNEQ
jgi:hypothetical protein